MTLEQLRIFVAVALREHVTQAARDLNLTQSATSAAIAALEQRHATRLFHRVGRRILLTEEGRIFLAEAKAVLARAAHAEAILDELAGLKRGSLVVKASQTIASHWLPGYLVRLKQAHPGLDIRLSVGNTAQVARAVRAGEVEIGFVEGEVDLPELETRIVGHDRLAVVVAADHPTGPDGGAPALGALDWILREEGSGTRSEFEKILTGFGIDPARLRVMLELPSNEAVRAAVEAGGGATALSELAAEAGLKAGTLRRLDYRMPRRPFFAVKSRDVEPSRAVAALLALMDPADGDSPALPSQDEAATP